MSIEAVTLDVYGTLFDLGPLLVPATEKLLAESRIEIEAESFAKILSEETFLRLARYEADPSTRFQTVGEITGEAFGAVFKKMGINGNVKRGVEIWFEFLHSIGPFPEVPDAVDRIVARYKVAIVSDADDEMLMPAWDRAGLPVEHIITSEAAKGYKIQQGTRIFAMAFEALQVEPHQTVHVGDARADVIGAINAGAKAIWLSRDEAPWEDEGIKPTAIARDFNEVVEILEKM